VSIASIDQITPAGWFPARAEEDPSGELGFRFAALQIGFWLGWASIVVVLVGLALDVTAPQPATRSRW
jgi:hypothetical protein